MGALVPLALFVVLRTRDESSDIARRHVDVVECVVRNGSYRGTSCLAECPMTAQEAHAVLNRQREKEEGTNPDPSHNPNYTARNLSVSLTTFEETFRSLHSNLAHSSPQLHQELMIPFKSKAKGHPPLDGEYQAGTR